MDVKEALQKRRSVRKFTAEPVSEADIEALLHAAMSGPSACNCRPWQFYVVTDPVTLALLRQSTKFTKITAPMAIVVCGDLLHSLPLAMSAFWIQDCSAATENILLQAVELGLGAVWCGIHPQKGGEKHVSEALHLPKTQTPLNILWIGHPAEQPQPRDQYDEKRVHRI